MPIPVWEVLEGAANTVEGQEHKPYNQMVNLSGQPMDLAGIMRDCARATREDHERRLKTSARNARSVSSQAERWLYDCPNCKAPSVMTRPTGVCRTCANRITRGPLVSPERVTAIKAFARSLVLLEEAYGVTLKGEDMGDLEIIDMTHRLPDGYEFSGWIDSATRELTIADWVVEPEAGRGI